VASPDRLISERRSLGYVVPLLGVLCAAGVALASLQAGNHANAFEQAAAILAGACIVAAGVFVPPSWTLSAALVLTVFNGDWRLMGISAPIDRIALLAGGLGIVLRELRAGRGLRTQPVHWLLMLSATYAVTSGVLAGTLGDPATKFSLLDRFGLIPYLAFFAVPFAFRTAADRRVLLAALVGLGAYLGVTALLETTGPSALVIPGYITDPTVGIHFDRARGPFLEANAMGLALFGCGVASVIAAVTWADRRWRRFAWAVAALCTLGIVFTLTRGTWLAAIAGALVALLSAHRTRRVVLPVAAAVAVAVLGAFLVIPGFQAHATNRLNDQSSVWDRSNSNAAALRMIAVHPLFGFGLGEFQFQSADYYRQAPDFPLTSLRNIHNVYLAYATELGLVGGGLWLLTLLVTFGASLRRRGPPDLQPWRLGLIAVAVSWMVTSATEPLSFPFPALLLWAWAGVVYGGSRAAGAATPPTNEQRA
jgi:putative inorganic carbon (HCO3(-)) transporter